MQDPHALRIALRPWLTSATSPVHAYVRVVTDAFILFFAGFACAQAAEMFIRGRALLSAGAREWAVIPGW